jgi:hypothetical protein
VAGGDQNIRRGLIGLVTLCGAALAVTFDVWLQNAEAHSITFSVVVLSTIIAILALIVIWSMMNTPGSSALHAVLVGLIVFELFTVNMDAPSNYDSVPPTQQVSFSPPPLVAQVLSDTPFRVDGYRGITDNYGSLYNIMDMRGISPLFLATPFAIIEPEKINPLAWELFAVRYVYTDWQELPIESEIIGNSEDRYGAVNLHRLENPRPFAHLVYDAEILDSDAFALALLRDPNFDPRSTAILNREPSVELSEPPANTGSATVTHFAPEAFTVEVNTPANTILTLAHPDYPGWQATIDNQPAEILRAYGGLSALAIPSGSHIVQMVYDPISYRVGSLISLLTWLTLAMLTFAFIVRTVRASRRGKQLRPQ